uniref:Uncharacterized protein n=1 Tax=Oryza brachyantha TaxID=4533 RepID=J3LAF4_ORYBR
MPNEPFIVNRCCICFLPVMVPGPCDMFERFYNHLSTCQQLQFVRIIELLKIKEKDLYKSGESFMA